MKDEEISVVDTLSENVIKIKLKTNRRKRKTLHNAEFATLHEKIQKNNEIMSEVIESHDNTENTKLEENSKNPETSNNLNKGRPRGRRRNSKQVTVDLQRKKWVEKQRKYREGVAADPERSEKAKRNEREQYRQRREKGQLKNISEMGKPEQQKQRKMWRESSAKYYRRKKKDKVIQIFIDVNNLPTPLEEDISKERLRDIKQAAVDLQRKKWTERKRKYRERIAADPEMSEKAKIYERNRNRNRKQMGKLNNIGDMGKGEKQMEKCGEASQQYKSENAIEHFIDVNNLPSSPLLEETSKESNIKQAAVDLQRKKWAERKRKYRERVAADPERSEKAKLCERQRNRKRREIGQLKHIAEMGKGDQKKQREKWREASQKYYRRKKTEEVLENVIDVNNLPSSPLVKYVPGDASANHVDIGSKTFRQKTERKPQKSNAEKRRQQIHYLKIKLASANRDAEIWKRKFKRAIKSTLSPSSNKEVEAEHEKIMKVEIKS